MGSEYAILYLEINIVSIVLIAIILKKTTGLSKMVAQRNFAMSIIAEMVFFASDTFFVMIIKDSINDNLRAINERKKLPFDLTVSIGYAYTNGGDTLKELIDRADEAMYEAKKESR